VWAQENLGPHVVKGDFRNFLWLCGATKRALIGAEEISWGELQPQWEDGINPSEEERDLFGIQ
jgi:hypothetical protein